MQLVLLWEESKDEFHSNMLLNKMVLGIRISALFDKLGVNLVQQILLLQVPPRQRSE